MRIVVLMNTGDGMFWEYIPERSVLSHAHTFDLPFDRAVIGEVAETVYNMCNVDPEDLSPSQYTDQVSHYRARRNRSLSVGDVIVLLHGEAPIIALAYQREGLKLLGQESAADGAEAILAQVDLSDIDNHLEHSLAWEAHVAIRDNPPSPFVSPL